MKNPRSLKWLENGPRRLDVDIPLLAIGIPVRAYPETFPDNLIITTGGGLSEGHYLAADEAVLEEMEIGVIFQREIPQVVRKLFLEHSGDVWLTGEVMRGEFLVQDIFLGERRLIREELKDTLKKLNLESIDDQFLGYH